MNVKPLGDRVLLKALKEDNITKSWIYIPDSSSKERPYIYEVVAVWPGTKDKEMTVRSWDKVLSGQYSGDDVKVDWNEFKIVWIDYILAIVD